ncbi:TetR/AcrR family transcriptional regulator [Microbacterium thalassium]|uniref:AcrR family transcriptional regulator n=1 Tax=Microbacterium thalassium TaxID=362649 RepID=A0A7X0KW00_9MICO|nr:TetR/AcrR family transcriptional regulator [Microbacterium thalassium]MBB6392762.1 AcrR family transcriptional regulator [Microbacterium thalassium]GLK23007.1 hypothetical protein GCM10017607_03250 [Microbacterium thalassium]
MSESATLGRERKRAETTRTLISLARQATASDGLHGFTIEELCERAGISRRTFFNYFASKEDAVLGIALRDDTSEADERFVALRPDTATGEVSRTLLADYAELLTERWAALDVDRAAAMELMAATEAEPRLISHMLDRHRRDEMRDAALVARREHLPVDDPRVLVAVQTVGHLARVAVPASLDPDRPRTFADVLGELLTVTRAVFDSQTPAASPHPEGTP